MEIDLRWHLEIAQLWLQSNSNSPNSQEELTITTNALKYFED
jgi:hypothetical protein